MIDLNGNVKVSAGVLLCAFLVLPLFSLAVSTPDRRPVEGTSVDQHSLTSDMTPLARKGEVLVQRARQGFRTWAGSCS